MYYSYWLLLVVLSLWVSLLAFIWGLKSGQFSDQGRARYLALRGTPATVRPEPGQNSGKSSAGLYALLFVIVLGVSIMLTAALLSLYKMKG